MNLLAIIVATVVGMGVGALWYSPRFFGSTWMHELRLDQKKVSKDPAKSTYLFTALGTLIMAIVLGQIIRIFSTTPSALDGGLVGLLIGIGLVAPAIAINYTFEGKSQRLFLITSGHHVITLLVEGIIIGLLS